MDYIVTYNASPNTDTVRGKLIYFDKQSGVAEFNVGTVKPLVLDDVESVVEA